MTTTVLFEDERARRLDDYDVERQLAEKSLLWIDLNQSSSEDLDKISDRFDLADATVEQLRAHGGSAIFDDAGHYIHLSLFAPVDSDPDRELQMAEVQCLLGERWVVTATSDRYR